MKANGLLLLGITNSYNTRNITYKIQKHRFTCRLVADVNVVQYFNTASLLKHVKLSTLAAKTNTTVTATKQHHHCIKEPSYFTQMQHR